MTVYIDDMFKSKLGKYHNMKMSHMVADTEAELHAMAEKIGIRRKWYQGDHYDICLSKRKEAIELGAVEVTMRQLGAMLLIKRKTGKFPSPEKAEQKLKEVVYGRERKETKS